MLLLAIPAAEACSCSFERPLSPTPAECASSDRVFAGHVAALERAPVELFFLHRVRNVEVLAIDAVWRGDVGPREVVETGFGNGDCGMPLPAGTRFLACDDGAPTPWSFCRHPAFDDEMAALRASQGPAGAPRGTATPRFPWLRLADVGIFLGITLTAAALGALVRFGVPWRTRPTTPRRFAAYAAGIGMLTLLPRVAGGFDLVSATTLATPVLALTAACVFGFAAALSCGDRRVALLGALSLATVPLAARMLPSSWPWPSDEALWCSIDRARTMVIEGRSVWKGRTVRACTDLGVHPIEWVWERSVAFRSAGRVYVVTADGSGDAAVRILPDDAR